MLNSWNISLRAATLNVVVGLVTWVFSTLYHCIRPASPKKPVEPIDDVIARIKDNARRVYQTYGNYPQYTKIDVTTKRTPNCHPGLAKYTYSDSWVVVVLGTHPHGHSVELHRNGSESRMLFDYNERRPYEELDQQLKAKVEHHDEQVRRMEARYECNTLGQGDVTRRWMHEAGKASHPNPW